MKRTNGFATIVQFAPGTRFVEAYGLLLVTMVLGKNGHPPGIVAVTCAEHGEGATTTVLNLGIMMARTGRATLLVDANLRRPELHKAFDLPLAPGLADALVGKANVERIVQRTRLDHLAVVPAGHPDVPPHALLDHSRLTPLITGLRAQYEFVVLDTPPVLHYPDMLNLARLVDGTLIVVPAHRTSRRAQQEIRRRLNQVNAQILGAVLNRVAPREVEPGQGRPTTET